MKTRDELIEEKRANRGMKKTKTIRAWAILRRRGKAFSHIERDEYNAKSWGEEFIVVPCTITYQTGKA